MRKFRNNVAAGAWIALALGLLVLPLRWLIAAFAAAFFHELCHWSAVRLCGGSMADFHMGIGGAQMEVAGLSRGQELFCALAGPLGGLLLLFFAKWFPAVAVCGVFQSAYNLLPVYPMDGGRALRCGARLILSPRVAELVCTWLERICMSTLVLAGIYAAIFLKLGLMPLILALVVILKKFLANRADNEYNRPSNIKGVRL